MRQPLGILEMKLRENSFDLISGEYQLLIGLSCCFTSSNFSSILG